MYKKLFPLIIVLLLSITIASTSHAEWSQTFHVSDVGEFNRLTAYIFEGSTMFADVQNEYFSYVPGENGWSVDPKQNTFFFDAITGTFHTTVDFNVYFSDPISAPFKFDLEVWWDPRIINITWPGYEYFNTNQAPVLLQIVHYVWSGIAMSYTISTPPSPPTNVQASDGTYPDKVQVTWAASSGATSYEIWRNTINDLGAATQIAQSVVGTSYYDTTVFEATTYYYWVQAIDSYGTKSSFSAPDTGYRGTASAPPLPPTNVQASDGFFTGWVQVTWVGSSGATSYEIWRNTLNDPGTATQISLIVGPAYNDTTAVAGTNYYYWVKAKNSFGVSDFSVPDTGYRGTAPSGNLLTVTKAGTGGGMIMSSLSGINCGPDCSEIYAAGTSVTLTATSDATSRFISWDGCDSGSGNPCTVNMSSNKTVTASFVYRRLENLDIAVYDGSLSGLFTVFPGFRSLLQSATLTGPGVSYQYNLQNETLRWLSECRYLDGWTKSFSSFGYGEYTLTLNFYDGVTEIYKKNLQPASVTAVVADSIAVTILDNGSANVTWTPPLTGQYYGVRVRSADGSIEYFRSSAQLNASSLSISAQSLGCLERGQTYRWLVRAYDSPEMSYEGASTYHAVATSYIMSPYNPFLPGQRATSYTATDWDGKLTLGFDVRPGSRGEVLQATVTGPTDFSYPFDLLADKLDLSTATRTNKLWWKQFDPPLEYGGYIFQIEFSDTHTETLTKTLTQVPITPVDAGTMSSMIQPIGAIGFNWGLPEGVSNQYYVVRISSLDWTKEYYSSSRLLDRNAVFASFWELRGLEHCKTYQWFVRAYDQFDNTMRQSSSQTFFYNPFNIVNTPAGSNVTAAAGDGTNVTFSNVASPGITEVAVTNDGPSPPAGFSLGDPPTYYNISTTATFTGGLAVCIKYDPARYGDPNTLSLLHFENGSWVNVMTSHDTTNHVICGQVNSLSPFIIAEQSINRPPVAEAGSNRAIEATSPSGASVTLNGAGSFDPDGDSITYTWTGPFGTTTGATPTVSLPLGTHTITLTVTDSKGATGTDTVQVSVRDTTPPSISFEGCPGTVQLNATATVTVAVSDTASGVAFQSASTGLNTLDTSKVNTNTFTVTARDKAGNESSNHCTYSVVYNFVGFKPPMKNPTVVNVTTAGRVVPVKWQLPDGKGGFISDLGVVTTPIYFTPVDCKKWANSPKNTVSAATSGTPGLRYDATGNQYIYNWKTDRSWAGCCYQLILILDDGSEYRANFSLK